MSDPLDKYYTRDVLMIIRMSLAIGFVFGCGVGAIVMLFFCP